LFSEKGYSGTSIQDIADELNITKTALYRHYLNKEDIWNSTIDFLEIYYAKTVGISTYPHSLEDLKEMTISKIKVTVSDEKIIKVRKVLNIEQYRDERTAKLASNHVIYGMKEYYTDIFSAMQEKGILKKCDTEIMALSYVAPITSLIHICDRQPEKKAEIISIAEKFIDQFIETYKN